MFEGVDRVPRPGEAGGAWSYAGRQVSVDEASSLPAVMACIRLRAETAASLPVRLFEQDGDQLQAPVNYKDQVAILSREPNSDMTAFQLWYHVFSSLDGWGGAYLLKAKAKGRVESLYPLDPSRVIPRVEDGELVFYVRNSAYGGRQPHDPKGTRLTRSDILYIPGLLLNDPYIGVSPISVHRHMLGNALAQQEYAGRYYANDGSPGGVISVQGQLTKEKRDEIKEAWEARHRGASASHRVAVLSGGAEFNSVGINLRDAQFIEGQLSSTQDVCRIFGVPVGLLDAHGFSVRTTPEEDMSRFALRLSPTLRRVESAIETDKDLFPDGPGSRFSDADPVVRFDTNHLVRADQSKRFASYTAARQGGWMSANEIRAFENLPPVEGGDEVQATPVGGAPNPDPVTD